MENKREDLIQKILSKVTPDNIDKKLLFHSSLLERLMNRKECYDININTSVKQRACKKPMKKIKMDFLELVSDEDSSSDYIPSDIDSEDSDEDSD
jgi:myosin-crossreactive antigen